MGQDIECRIAKRKSALVLGIIQGKPMVTKASRAYDLFLSRSKSNARPDNDQKAFSTLEPSHQRPHQALKMKTLPRHLP